MITYHGEDNVILRGYSSKPLKLTLQGWLKSTDAAITVFEAATARGVRTNGDATSGEWRAKLWLTASFPHASKLSEAIAGYKERRPLFDLPPDPSRIIRCRSCNSPLSDPISKLLGIGPICRNPKKTTVRLAHVRSFSIGERVEVAA